MEKDWVKIYSTTNPMEAAILVSMLQENDIDAVEMNKIDSSYTVFGRAEIYCRNEQAMWATQLIENRHAK